MAHFDLLWQQARPAFQQTRTWQRARTLAGGLLACLGRHTITGMLTCSGQQFVDWSAAYRLFEHARISEDRLWAPVRRAVGNLLPVAQAFVAVLDDTLVGKRGRKVSGTAWRRDPLGPPFRPNFIWAQRFLQIAAMLPQGPGASRARAIPIELQHCPSAAPPGRRTTAEQQRQYRLEQQAQRLPAVAAQRLQALRSSLDADPGGAQRPLMVAVDGGYTNRTVFRQIPARTCVVGRVRKDAKLYAPPTPRAGRGRRRIYGTALPTPEQIRQDERFPWQMVQAYAAGKIHQFEVKVVGPVRWPGAGERDLLLLVIRPLAYRPTKHSRLLYRQPAYLLCTDPTLPLTQILQTYLWRSEIELTFRDEKTIIGLGEAQVRNHRAVSAAPAFVAAAYAYLHVAAATAGLCAARLPRPKWQRTLPDQRHTTGRLIGLLRGELWGRALGVNIDGFAAQRDLTMNALKSRNNAAAAVIYSHR
jgi:hypothetical protein